MKITLLYLTGALALGSLAGCADAPPRERVYVEERIVRVPPPPPRQEVIIAAPGPVERFVWDPGHWSWDGHGYRWSGGHWIERRMGGQWIPAHWDQSPDGWRFVQGHWR
jgi:hypothetical protein